MVGVLLVSPPRNGYTQKDTQPDRQERLLEYILARPWDLLLRLTSTLWTLGRAWDPPGPGAEGGSKE